MAKGEITKNKILQTARNLFYERGYKATTARNIAETAGVNLGLLTYYFKSKSELGRLVYADIRHKFEEYIDKYEPGLSELDKFLFSSELELYLCLECRKFGDFYHEYMSDTANRKTVKDHIIRTLQNNKTYHGDDEAYVMLATLSISAIKPALVEYGLSYPERIPTDIYLKYYLGEQLHFLGRDKNAEDYISMLHKYHIDVTEKFTPVMVPLE